LSNIIFETLAPVLARRVFRGWHLSTVTRALCPKGAPLYSSDRRNGRWIDDQSKQFSSR